MQEYIFQITEEEEGERVDRHLSLLMDTLSRSYLQKLLKDGQVSREMKDGNVRPLRASYRVQNGDRIHLHIPEAVFPPLEAEDIALDVIYEDADLLVVNKPKGMVVHPAPGHYSGTLVNALLYYCRESLSGINGILRPGIVHRIDRDTSGAIIVCKNDFAHQDIARQLKAHLVKREYVAIVHGVIKENMGVIRTHIGRHPKERKKMAVLPASDESAKEAITHFKVLERFRKFTFVACRLETGRTHQIRVHMAYLGFPILGDAVYGGGRSAFKVSGQTLHAACLGFMHPASKVDLEISAPLPGYFAELVKMMD